jgi:molybdenum-dependent DNA-binding transcriptional regulator ModE
MYIAQGMAAHRRVERHVCFAPRRNPPGGRGGGNAGLTLPGRAVVQLYRSLEQDAHEAAATKLQELDRHIRHAAKGAGKVEVVPARARQPTAKQRS